MRRAFLPPSRRYFFQRIRSNFVHRISVFAIAVRLQSTNGSPEHEHKKKRHIKFYAPTKVRFNENADFSDFLGGSAETAKEDEAIPGYPSKSETTYNALLDPISTKDHLQKESAAVEVPKPFQNYEGLQTEMDMIEAKVGSPIVTWESKELIPNREQDISESQLSCKLGLRCDVKAEKSDKKENIETATQVSLSVSDYVPDSSPSKQPHQPLEKEIEHIQHYEPRSKVLEDAEQARIRCDHTSRIRLLFRENRAQLSELSMIPLKEISSEDEFVPLSRMHNDSQFQQMYPDWHYNYATLFAKNIHPSSSIEPVFVLQSRKTFSRAIRAIRSSEAEMKNKSWDFAGKRFVQSHPYKSKEEWADFMLLTMRYTPHLTAGALKASYPHLKPPFYMVADIIHFITRFGMECELDTNGVRSNKRDPSKITAHEVVELILEIIPQCTHESSFILNATIVQLLGQIDLQFAYALFNGLCAFQSHISCSSWIAFARHFGKNGDYETAISALDSCLKHGGSATDMRVKRAASYILRRSIVNPDGHHHSGYIINRFIEMGLRIGLIMQTALIANAFDSRDRSTALDVFALMRDQGIEPDAVTYGTLLKGLSDCKDHDLVDEVLSLSWAKAEETRDERLASYVLYWHFLQYMRRASDVWNKEEKTRIHCEALRQLVMLFTRIFDWKPLDVLGFPYLEFAEYQSPHASLKIKPTDTAMNIMFLAHSRAYLPSLQFEGASLASHVCSVAQLFERWWLIATRGDLYPEVDDWIKDLFINMIKNGFALNNFMHALGADAKSLYYAITILQHMEKGFVGISKASTTEYLSESIKGPSLYTWSILLNIFARHAQIDAMEKCLKIMQSRGCRPDRAVWNTVIKAYAVAQRPNDVIKALRRKEEAGYGHDDDVIRTLARFRDKELLKALLRTELRSREASTYDAGVLSRVAGLQRVDKKWTPHVNEVSTYEPGIGPRQVQFFDANRTLGLQKGCVVPTEDGEDEEAADISNCENESQSLRVLDGKGVYSLKSEVEEDWFENYDEEENPHRDISDGSS
ncbi:uncharacterized protein PV09_03648 [Verruconis gallopava]|uniref:Pentacotripeptide-repeat region of PRORP domain-containing protein n=1 Tax=Verruconis gallopava TaxID=253628 RepID=A0A0D1XQY8_9PEZI|nr:uncharacterized protein PV09_03648 [Verruconis gallopava]KIW05091.1 hypothetical protein PV09_03648 [Verruconis gallopava]